LKCFRLAPENFIPVSEGRCRCRQAPEGARESELPTGPARSSTHQDGPDAGVRVPQGTGSPAAYVRCTGDSGMAPELVRQEFAVLELSPVPNSLSGASCSPR
jgi:hypothetical protein